MGHRHLLLIVFTINLVVRIEAISTDQALSSVKRMLREETRFSGNIKSPTEADEERGVAWDGTKMLWNGVKMKYARARWLNNQKSPDAILHTLDILDETDKAFKYYSKYFMEYYNKFGGRPSHYAPRDTHTIIMKRLEFWLRESATPPQVAAKLERLGSQGQPYSDLYEQMYKELQLRLGGTQPHVSIYP